MTEPIKARLRAMAMAFDVTLEGVASEAAAKSAIDGVHRELLRADDLFSLYRADTPMAALANGTATLADMPQDVIEVLRLCETYRVATGGAFDAKRPDGVIDPTGIVKTWAVARATSRLGGVPSWLISASGDVIAHGGEYEGWHRRSRSQGRPHGLKVLDVVTLGGDFTAVATSGSSQVADHIWDPVTGKPARYFLQASVAGGTSWSATPGQRPSARAAGRWSSARWPRGSRCSS